MLPRNLTLFRFGPDVASSLLAQGIATPLATHPVRESSSLEMQTSGFASPYAPGDDRMTVTSNACAGFVFQQYERILPAASIADAVAKKFAPSPGKKGAESVVGSARPSARMY